MRGAGISLHTVESSNATKDGKLEVKKAKAGEGQTNLLSVETIVTIFFKPEDQGVVKSK